MIIAVIKKKKRKENKKQTKQTKRNNNNKPMLAVPQEPLPPPQTFSINPHPDLELYFYVLEIHEHLFFKILAPNSCFLKKKKRKQKQTNQKQKKNNNNNNKTITNKSK